MGKHCKASRRLAGVQDRFASLALRIAGASHGSSCSHPLPSSPRLALSAIRATDILVAFVVHEVSVLLSFIQSTFLRKCRTISFARVHQISSELTSVPTRLSMRVYYAHDRTAAVLVPMRTAWPESPRKSLKRGTHLLARCIMAQAYFDQILDSSSCIPSCII